MIGSVEIVRRKVMSQAASVLRRALCRRQRIHRSSWGRTGCHGLGSWLLIIALGSIHGAISGAAGKNGRVGSHDGPLKRLKLADNSARIGSGL